MTPLEKYSIHSSITQPKFLYSLISHNEDLKGYEREASHGIVYNPQSCLFLVHQEVTNPYARSKYTLLGGKIEEGESAFDALVREIEEESGVESREITGSQYIGTRILGWVFMPQKVNITLVNHLYFIITHSTKSDFEADGCISRWIDEKEFSREFETEAKLIKCENILM